MSRQSAIDSPEIGDRARETRAAEDAARGGCNCPRNPWGDIKHEPYCRLAPPSSETLMACPAAAMMVRDVIDLCERHGIRVEAVRQRGGR
jgi:hypothetical protein